MQNVDQYKNPSPTLLDGQTVAPLMVRYRCSKDDCNTEDVLNAYQGVPTHAHLVGVKRRYFVMQGVAVVGGPPVALDAPSQTAFSHAGHKPSLDV